MNRLRKTLTGITAMVCMLSATACNSKESVSQKEESKATQIQQMADTSYKPVKIDANIPLDEVSQLIPIGDTGKFIVSGYATEDGEYIAKGFITDADFTVFNEIFLDLDQESFSDYDADFVAANDGTAYAILTLIDYGDFEVPDFNSPDFDPESFDFEAMEAAATYSYKILTIDEDGFFSNKKGIHGLEKYVDTSGSNGVVYINDSFAIGDDKLCLSISSGAEPSFVVIDGSGSISEPVNLGAERQSGIYGADRDNNFVFIANENGKSVLKTVDGNTLQLLPDTFPLDEALIFTGIIKGSGEYRVFLSSSTSLYGLKDDGTMVEIINWIDSDMRGDYIVGLVPVDNGDFFITEQDWSNGTTSVYRLTKRDASEIESVQIIDMAVEIANPNILEMVNSFNKTNDGYRIKVTDYSEYYEWDAESGKNLNSPERQLKQDLATGKTYDIICTSDTNGLMDNLAKKGALADLYTYLDNDSELSRDDIVPTVLSICEKDGKLTSLTPFFYVNTLTCKTEFCDKENWTLDDFMETCRNLPEGMKPFSSENTKSGIFGQLMTGGGNTFIDFENATCDFNNQKFIEVLEFCNEYDNLGEGDEINWLTATDEEMSAHMMRTETAVRDGRALLHTSYLSTPSDYARLKYGNFGEDITFVGSPSSDGRGAKIYPTMNYGIMETADNKDACWEFIKWHFNEEHQLTDVSMLNFPALKTAFDESFEEAMKRPYYLDGSGNKTEYDYTFPIGDDELEIPPLSREECDFFKKYITGIKSSSFYYDEEIFQIITEEADTYFIGDKTAEQVAEIIQNRVSILISEQS